MATGSTRDVKMVLSVESLGQENITKLQKALRDLAATGGESTAEFADLADQIGRLGDQGAALQSFKALAAETENLQDKQTATGASAEALAAKLDLARSAADRVKTAQLSARQELLAGEKAYTEAGNALRALKAEYDNAGKGTAEYRSRLQGLVAQQNTARTALIDLREANKLATASVTAAVSEQSKAEGAYKRAATQAAAAGEAVKQQAIALKQSGDAAQKLGVDVEDLARAEAELLSTFARGTTVLTDRRQAMLEMAEADRLAKIEAEGLAQIYRRGEAALQAETLAQRDAEKAVIAYTAAKNKAVADSAQWQKEADEIVALVEAQRRMQTVTQRTVEQLQELAAVNAFEKQASEAQRLVQAAQYVQFWEQALDEADRKQTELAANTRKVNDALNSLNVRSVEAVRDEITQTNTAMRTLADSGQLTGGALAVAMSRGQERVNALQREVRELTGSLTLADRAAGVLKNSMGQIAVGNLVADGIGFLVEKVKEMGRAFVTVALQTESARKALTAIYKDTATAASQMEFLRSTAIGAGVSISGITDDFVKFSASTKGANIPIEQSNALFQSLTRAASSLGLGAEKTGLALNALGQIASKGVVSMEELRQQLGDSVPGALSLTAKGLGITDAELIKLVETGQLAARDFFPAFTEGLKTLQGETDGARQTWERFKNVLSLGAVAAESNGAMVLLTGTLKVLGGFLAGLALGLSTIVEGLLSAGRAALLFYEVLKGNGKEAFAFFNAESDKMVGRLTEQANAFNAMLDPSQENLDRLAATSAANNQVAGTTAGVTSAIKLNTVELAANATQAALSEAGALAQAKANLVTQSSTIGVTEQWVKLKVELTTLAAQQTANVAVSEKLAKAAELEGVAAVRLAQLRGSEIGVLQASAEAATRNSAAINAVAVAREAEAAVLRVQANEMAKLAIAQDGSIEKRAVEIKAIADKVEKLDAEASAARNSAEAARIESKERALSVKLYRDNSAAVEQLTSAREEASANLTLAIDLEKLGLRTSQDVKFAQEELGVVTRVYNDALKDSVAQIEQASRAKTADLSVTQAGLAAEQRRYESLAAAARARGDEVQATYYSIEAKQREIEQIKLSVQVKQLEIEAARQSIAIQRQELDVADPLYAQKARELDIRLRLLDAQNLENKAKLNGITSIQTEIQNLREGTKAINDNTKSRLSNADAANKQAEATENAANKYAKPEGGSVTGNTREERLGGQNAVDASLQFKLLAKLKAGTLTGADEADIRNVIASLDQQETVNRDLDGFGGAFSAAGAADRAKWQQIRTQLAQALGTAAVGGRPAGVGSTDTAAAAEDKKSGARDGTNVTVNIGGQRRTIGVGSQSDANALVSVLRDLENQSGTAT